MSTDGRWKLGAGEFVSEVCDDRWYATCGSIDGDARPSLARGQTMGERRPSSAAVAAERDVGGTGTC